MKKHTVWGVSDYNQLTYSIAQRDRRDWKLFVLWNPETDRQTD